MAEEKKPKKQPKPPEAKTLNAIPPREQSGRDTINRYDYQFRKTGEAALELLEDDQVKVVYCDLHDDYVIQRSDGISTNFDFHQVKTKGKESHEWTFSEVFGVGAKTTTAKMAAGTSIIGKLFHHQLVFSMSCRTVSIVTNAFYVENIELLITELNKDPSEKSISAGSKTWLNKIVVAFDKDFDSFDRASFLDFLRKVKLRSNAGPLKDPEKSFASVYLEKIFKFSEVALTYPEALKIAEDLLLLVKDRSLSEIPTTITEADLIKSAGVTLEDILRILSISKPMYDILKAGGDPKAIRVTSQLMNLLKDLPDEAKVSACISKVEWESWLLKNRHIIPEIDFATLCGRCQQLVKTFAGKPVDLGLLGESIRQIQTEFSSKLPKGLDLSIDHIFGFFWTLAVKGQIQ